MASMNPDLAEYTIDQLVTEIASRCPTVVVLVAVPENNEECETRAYHYGNRLFRVGMLEVERARLVAETVSRGTEEDMD